GRARPGVCDAMAHSAMAHSMDLPPNHRSAASAAGRAIGLRIISPLTFELALPVLEGRLARALPGYFGLLRYLVELDAPLPDGFDPLGELPWFARSRRVRPLVISPAPAARPLIVATLLGAVASCQTVPLTNRPQLLLIPEGTEIQLGLSSYQEILQKARVSHDPALNEQVTRVGTRIAEATGRTDYQWE